VEVALQSKGDVKVRQGSAVIIGERRSGGPPSPEEMMRSGERLEQSKNTALAYINLASLYEKRGDHAKALEVVEKGVQLDPTDFYGLGVRGTVRSSLGDYAGAVADLSEAIKMAPKMAGKKYLDRGTAYLMLGQDNEAQQDFDKYLQLFPNAKTEVDKRIEEARKKRQQQ